MTCYLLVQIFKAEQERSVTKPFKTKKITVRAKITGIFFYQQQDVKKV